MSDTIQDRLAEHEQALEEQSEEEETGIEDITPDESLKINDLENEKLEELKEQEQQKEEIENIQTRIKSYDSTDLRKRALQLKKVVDLSYLEFGAVLHKVKNFEIYIDWGYESFKEYVENELDFKQRKAHYLESIWGKIKELDLSPEDLQGIPWSKMAAVHKILDKSNYEEWLTKARELPRPDLKQEVKEEKTGEEQEDSHRMQFTLMGDQYDNVQEALEAAEEIAESEKQGHLLDLICTEFLASNLGETNRDLSWILSQVERNFDVELDVVQDK